MLYVGPLTLWKRGFQITIGQWDIEISASALCEFTHMRRHRRDAGWHFVWWRFSCVIDDWTAEIYPLCAECDSPDIGEVSCGDEGWTVCRDCRSVEQGYRYVNKREAGQ